MANLIARNFKISIAVLVLACLVSSWHVSHSMEPVRAVYGPYSYDVLLDRLIALVVTAISWLVYYRDDEGQLLAFCIGWILVFAGIGLAASAAFNDLSYSKLELFIVLYSGLSHIAYGLLEWPEVLGRMGQ